MLKEYRNRWFLLAKSRKDKNLYTLALDRIVEFYELANEPFVDEQEINFDTYYNNAIGVTKSVKEREQRVVFRVNKKLAPYVVTKPIHATQKVLEVTDEGTLFSIEVVHNFELERELLGFGEEIEVLAPRLVKKRIKTRLEKALEKYKK